MSHSPPTLSQQHDTPDNEPLRVPMTSLKVFYGQKLCFAMKQTIDGNWIVLSKKKKTKKLGKKTGLMAKLWRQHKRACEPALNNAKKK